MLRNLARTVSPECKLGYALGKHRQENLYVGHAGDTRSERCAHHYGAWTGN